MSPIKKGGMFSAVLKALIFGERGEGRKGYQQTVDFRNTHVLGTLLVVK